MVNINSSGEFLAPGMLEIASQVIYCDEALLIVNKPSGLLTIRDGYDPTLPYVTALFQAEYGKLFAVHRLDRDTSGVLVLARSAEAHRDLNAQFRIREIKKIYHALAQGVPDWSKKTVDLPLRVDGDRKHRTVVNYEKGKIAITELEVVQLFIGYSLISAQPRSGYTHQIRAHLAAFGLPILQDTLYAPPGISQPATLPIKRLALHALSITFIHPISRQLISFDAPYPADFSCLLAELKSRAD